MNNEQARRANGARIESERRANGVRIESERRAIGTNNEAARRGVTASSLKRDLNSLETGARRTSQLRTIESRGARPATKGRADWTQDKEPATGGGGIASPLTEASYAAREFHPAQALSTSDGLFVWEFEPLKKVVMTDANDAPVVQIFAEPS